MSEVTLQVSTETEAALRYSLTPVHAELTLQQAQFHTHISPAILRRRWKNLEAWKHVIYMVGDDDSKVKHMRTTIYLIREAQKKAAEMAREELKTKKPMKKH